MHENARDAVGELGALHERRTALRIASGDEFDGGDVTPDVSYLVKQAFKILCCLRRIGRCDYRLG